MAVKTVYVSKLGRDYKISTNFKLSEFQSKDGADKVLYSEELLAKLEEARAYGGFTISVNSGYRSPAHNKRVGGATNSNHTKGMAADVVFRKDGEIVDAKLVCCLCQSLGFNGVAYISANAVHLDVSNRTYRGDERKGYGNNVGGDFYKYFSISKAKIEALKVKTEAEEPKTEEPKKETGANEMAYKDITEVPEWGRKSVQLRIDHGWTDGKNITESMVRCWVIEDRENPYISELKDVPAWAVDEVKALMAAGKIKGNTVEPIGKRWQVIEALIMASR